MTGIVVTRTQDQDGNNVIIVSDGYLPPVVIKDDIDPNTNIRWKYQPRHTFLWQPLRRNP